MPSTMQWWILKTSAQRPPSSPSTSHVSHSGRSRSSGSDISRPIRRQNAASSPGAASAVWRRWYSRSKCGSSTQTGRPSSNGTRPDALAVPRDQVELGRDERRATSSNVGGGSANTHAPAMCMWAMPSSTWRNSASSALRRSSSAPVTRPPEDPGVRAAEREHLLRPAPQAALVPDAVEDGHGRRAQQRIASRGPGENVSLDACADRCARSSHQPFAVRWTRDPACRRTRVHGHDRPPAIG